MGDLEANTPPWAKDEEVKTAKPRAYELNATKAKALLEGITNIETLREEYRLEEESKGRKTVMEFCLNKIQEMGPKIGVIKEAAEKKPEPKKIAPPPKSAIWARFILVSGREYTIPFKSAGLLKGVLKRFNAAAHNPRIIPTVMHNGQQIFLYGVEVIELAPGINLDLSRPGTE